VRRKIPHVRVFSILPIEKAFKHRKSDQNLLQMNEIVIMRSLFAALDRKNSVQGEAAKLGQVKIQDLRPDHIQNLYTTLLDDEVGDYTIIKVHTVLHSALQQATYIGMISRNPASYAQPPKEPATEMAILNESQVSQLLVAANGHRWEALYHLAIVTGMRQMELLGLK
jgi:integrase